MTKYQEQVTHIETRMAEVDASFLAETNAGTLEGRRLAVLSRVAKLMDTAEAALTGLKEEIATDDHHVEVTC